MKNLFIPVILFLCIGADAQQKLSEVPGNYTHPNLLTPFKDRLVYIGSNQNSFSNFLWSYDGFMEPSPTEDGSFFLSSSLLPDYKYRLVTYGNYLYFPARNPWAVGTNSKLYRWNGYDAPTHLDDGIDNKNNHPRFICILNNKLYAVFDSIGAVNQLWEYDLTTDKGKRLTNYNPIYGHGASITDIVAFNDKIYFTATPVNQFVLMEYDPASGIISTVPSELPDLYYPGQFLVVDDKLYFTASLKIPGPVFKMKYQLCMYDGKNPINILTSFTNESEANNKGALALFKNKVYFQYGNNNDYRFWTYDIETGIYEPEKHLRYIAASRLFREYNGKLFFSGASSVGKTVLYSYDGLTPKVIDYYNSSPAELTVVNNIIYYTAYDSTGNERIFSYFEGEPSEPYSEKNTLFPNPASATATLRFTLDKEQPLSFIITDMSGRVAYRAPLKNYHEGDNSIQFNTSSLESGIYNCTLASENNHAIITKKLSKK